MNQQWIFTFHLIWRDTKWHDLLSTWLLNNDTLYSIEIWQYISATLQKAYSLSRNTCSCCGIFKVKYTNQQAIIICVTFFENVYLQLHIYTHSIHMYLLHIHLTHWCQKHVLCTLVLFYQCFCINLLYKYINLTIYVN